MSSGGIGFACSAKKKSEDTLTLEFTHRTLHPEQSVTWTWGGSWPDVGGDGRDSHLFRVIFVSLVDTLSAGEEASLSRLSFWSVRGVRRGQVATTRHTVTSGSKTLKASPKKGNECFCVYVFVVGGNIFISAERKSISYLSCTPGSCQQREQQMKAQARAVQAVVPGILGCLGSTGSIVTPHGEKRRAGNPQHRPSRSPLSKKPPEDPNM